MVVKKKKTKVNKTKYIEKIKKKRKKKLKVVKGNFVNLKKETREYVKSLNKCLIGSHQTVKGSLIIVAWAVFLFLLVIIYSFLGQSLFVIQYNKLNLNFAYSFERKAQNKIECEFNHPLTGECSYWEKDEDLKKPLDLEAELLEQSGNQEEDLEADSIVEIEDQKVFTVMVENHPEARPQSGLSSAQVVYEALVEGGITRFLLVFDNLHDLDTEIGPVRSARPYYLWFAYELDDALYGHVGGSPESLEYIQVKAMNDCDEFLYGGIFYERISQRRAPHNTYTSVSDLEGCNDGAKMGRLSEIDSWTFMSDGEDKVISSPVVSEIKIAYSNYTYLATWQYNQEDRLYYRFYADGQPNLDKENNLQISTSNVVVLEMPSHVIDDYGRLSMDSIGDGDLIIYRKGEKIEGTWEKYSKEERIMFLDENGDDIELVSGKVWIQVVPDLEIVEEN